MPGRITERNRWAVVVFAEEGMSLRSISAKLSISCNAVKSILRRYTETGSVQDRPRSGQPQVTSSDVDRRIMMSSLRDRRKTSVDIAESINGEGCTQTQSQGGNVSPRTIQRRLQNFGLHGQVARKKPLLRAKNKRARLQ